MAKREQTKRGARHWISTALQLVAILLIVLLLRTFVIGTIYVKGSSMEPNFHHGDFLIVNKLETLVSAPERGDVVICALEEGAYGGENIIKRVIGLPGDEIDLRLQEDGTYRTYINAKAQTEPYIAEEMMDGGDISYPFVVPEGCYFVMGDNRNASTDSRRLSIGSIAKEDIMGKVVLRVFPFRSFGLIE